MMTKKGPRGLPRTTPLADIAAQVDALCEALEPHLHDVERDADGYCVHHAQGHEQWELETAQRLLYVAAREIHIVAQEQLERQAKPSADGPH